jgi:phosphoribosylanthranilate isomerase
VFVKICGITSEEDALLAVAMDADAVGFIFAPSARRVRPDDVRDIVKRLPPEVMTVGVFQNERPEVVCDVVNRMGLRAAQLHGGEPETEVTWVRERVPVVIRALPVGDRRLADADKSKADVLLVDSKDPGSGKVFDWSLVEGVPTSVPILLAGGLTPENVGAAIARVRPWGVDVATGVEQSPGRKDPTKLRRFVETARAAAEELEDHDWAPGGEPPYDWMAE